MLNFLHVDVSYFEVPVELLCEIIEICLILRSYIDRNLSYVFIFISSDSNLILCCIFACSCILF
jgi:hypothetical protein